MPQFSYTAVSFRGDRKEGQEEAASERDLAKLLGEKGYLLTSAKEQGKKKGAREILAFLNGIFGVPLTEKLMFSRNLQVMTGAGISLPRALEVLLRQSQNKKLRSALIVIHASVMKGSSFSAAIGQYPDIFSELFSNMVKIGEESGTLEQVLSHLTVQLEREHDLKSKVQGALLYPAVIVTTMIGVGILMLVTVVPQLAETFRDLNIRLPLTTRLVIAFATFLATKWYIAAVLFLVLAAGVIMLLRLALVRRLFDNFVLKLPVFSGMVKNIHLAITARTLSSLLGAGVPIVRSLEIASKTLGNWHFRVALEQASQALKQGGKLSKTLQQYPDLYPPVFVQMVEVGEETGQTASLLSKIADFFEGEVDALTKNLASVIEPVLMLFIGAAVGFFAVSMLQPMYSLLQSLQQQ